jgi:protoporphyrinogen oxidase
MRRGLSLLILTAAALTYPAVAADPTKLCATLATSKAAVGEDVPRDPKDRAAYELFLRERYGVEPREIVWGQDFPYVIRGGGERSFQPEVDVKNAITDEGEYDVIIVGSGPAALTAARYLTDKGLRVLILERDKEVGGLGQGGERKGVHYGRGAAYAAAVEGLVAKIYKHLGIGHYKRDFTIPEPIDSFYWNGKYYEGLWENPKAMAELPASFELFKFCLQHAAHEGRVTNQPMEEEDATFELDWMSMAGWVRTYPQTMAKLAETDPEAARIYKRFQEDPKVNRADPMKDVIGLLDLYGRSAFGDHADRISAAAFANFYSSELETRYTGNLGDGSLTEIIWKKLVRRRKLITLKTEAPAAKIVNRTDGADVYYIKDGKTYKAKAPKVIFGASLNVASRIIEDFEATAPEQYKAVQSLQHRHYLVINVHVKGHPWKRTYDLWLRDDSDYSQAESTDIIDGRWMDFNGHEGKRTDDRGVLTIYQPLPESATKEKLTDEKTREIAERAVAKATKLLTQLSKDHDEGLAVKPMLVEINRWLYSIHLVEPGHFSKATILKKPVGNVFFADNNLGVPSIEEGIYRGYEAAQDVLATAKKPKKKKRAKRSVPRSDESSVDHLISWIA